MENPNYTLSSSRTDYGSTTLQQSSSGTASDSRPLSTFAARSNSYQRLASTPTPRRPQDTRFSKMPLDSKEQRSQVRQVLERVEYFLNVLNQICIGFITIYMSWLCLRLGLAGTALHAWLVTIGFSFLMAEGIMCHYSNNVLTFTYKRTTKTTIHWVLQALGGSLGVIGALIKLIQKDFVLKSTHSKLGLAALILCVVSMMSGLGALNSQRVKQFLSPLLNKTFHNLLGFATFVIALLAQFYGYTTGFFIRKAPFDFQVMIQCLTLLSLVLTSIGPLKALYQRSGNTFRNLK